MLLHTTLKQSVIVPPGLRCRRQCHGPSAGAAAVFGPWRGLSPTPVLEGDAWRRRGPALAQSRAASEQVARGRRQPPLVRARQSPGPVPVLNHPVMCKTCPFI